MLAKTHVKHNLSMPIVTQQHNQTGNLKEKKTQHNYGDRIGKTKKVACDSPLTDSDNPTKHSIFSFPRMIKPLKLAQRAHLNVFTYCLQMQHDGQQAQALSSSKHKFTLNEL